jgi:SAM-dependent methyltransferase
MLSRAWRAGVVPGGAQVPDSRLTELVEGRVGGPAALRPGRALDLGCGTGRNSIYLARQGWDVVAIELAEYAIDIARNRADDAGVSVRFIEGDVTKLPEFDIGSGFSLLVDVGCYQALPAKEQAAYIASTTQVAAPGAVLLMLAIMHIPGKPSLTPDDVRDHFRGWDLTEASPVRTTELNSYNKGVPSRVLSAAMSGFKARRYELRRLAD